MTATKTTKLICLPEMNTEAEVKDEACRLLAMPPGIVTLKHVGSSLSARETPQGGLYTLLIRRTD